MQGFESNLFGTLRVVEGGGERFRAHCFGDVHFQYARPVPSLL
jgi:hypothetical protein